jgi:hypothetical protein
MKIGKPISESLIKLIGADMLNSMSVWDSAWSSVSEPVWDLVWGSLWNELWDEINIQYENR